MAVARKVSPHIQKQKFTECLNPVIWYFRIIGYPLNYTLASKTVRILIIGNCIAMLVFDAWIHVDDMKEIIAPEKSDQSKETQSKDSSSTAPPIRSPETTQVFSTSTQQSPISTTIYASTTFQAPASTVNPSESIQRKYATFALAEIINRTVLVTSVHLTFIWICLFGTWGKLWNRLKQLEAFNVSFDIRLVRRAIILGFIINILDIGLSAFAASQVSAMKQPRGSIKRKAIIVLTFLTKYLPVASGMIFCILITIALSFYHSLQKEIKKTTSCTKVTMDKWRTALLLVDRFIEGINETFGPVLLMIFAFVFFDFISNSYDLVLRIRNNSKTLVEYLFTAVEFALKIVEFCLMVGIPAKLRKAEEDVAFTMRKILIDDAVLRNEADISSLSLIAFHREVTAMGLFDLIGTTVTYVIIMYQFDE